MSNTESVRIDKFLWAVRIFKTRSIASEACRRGRILINNIEVKPSRSVSKDELIVVKKLPVTYTYRVIQTVEKRISPKLVTNYIEDLTSENEVIKLSLQKAGLNGYREKGAGRPTKKERRILDRFKDDYDLA